jgi:glycosyltransferase involved in cell wall biosynthesis
MTGRSAKLDKLIWEQTVSQMEARRQRAHLLHVPYLSAPILRSLPVVVTAHDMIPWVLPGYAGNPAFRLYLMVVAAGVKRANLIVTDSDASRRDVLRILKMPAHKVHTVYLGVTPPPAFTPAQLEEVRARYGLPPHFAFYMGGFDRRKNVPLLLRAWRRVLDSMAADAPPRSDESTPVLAIGGSVPVPGGIFPDVIGEATALGLMGGPGAPVRFLGAVGEGDKFALMSAARLFVYPSAYEGFGLDPLTAMACGCAVVSSLGGSLAEVVGDAGVLVPPQDEDALCGAIRRVWADGDLRAELACRGQQRARLFTWERTARQTHDLYLLALRQARRRRGSRGGRTQP